jgi:DNA-binding IclR family transcriptional regulator
MVSIANRCSTMPNGWPGSLRNRWYDAGIDHPIQSIERADQILRLLSGPSRRVGLAELSAELGLPKGTVFGILRTLQLLRLVEKDPESRKYQLGSRLLRLGMSYLDASELRRRALRWSDELAKRSNETVRLGVIDDRQVLVLHHVSGKADAQEAFPTGAVLPLHASAMGKVLLAASREAHQQVVASRLQAFTARTITDPERLAAELDEVRERGWAASLEELVEGVGSLAAAVTDRRGATVAALSLSAPITRLCRDGEPRSGMVLSVREFAGAISREFGAPPWELAGRSQFRADLGQRLEAELERRERAARDLRQDLHVRRAVQGGAWSSQHPRGLTTDTARSEMELTIRRQRRELAEMERELGELRERMLGSELQPTLPKVTVVTGMLAGPTAQERTVSGGAAPGACDRATPAPADAVAERLRGPTSAAPEAPQAVRVAPPAVEGHAPVSVAIRLFAEEFADQLLQRSQAALQQQFRGALGQCLQAGIEPRDDGCEDAPPQGCPTAIRHDTRLTALAAGR